MKRSLLLFAGLAIALGGANLQAADQPNAAEVKMREALRNTMIQLRTAQNDGAVLQAAKAELEKKSQEMEAKVKLLTQHGEQDREAASKKIEAMEAQMTAQSTAMERLKADLGKSQADYQAATALAKSTEAARKALEEEKIVLVRKTEDQKTKNAEMFKLGREILLRYEKFGLGEALGAKEPFVGTTRVKLESYTQDFQDKLNDQKIKP